MRIVLVTGLFPLLSESFVERHAKALAGRGHDVYVLAIERGDHPGDPDLQSTHNFKVSFLPLDGEFRRGIRLIRMLLPELLRHPRRTRLAVTTLLREGDDRLSFGDRLYRVIALERLQPDVVHFQFTNLGVRFRHSLPLLRVPTVVSCRAIDIDFWPEVDPVDGRHLGEVLGSVSAIHCVASALKDLAIEHGAPPERCVVIHPGLPLDDYPRAPVPRHNDRVRLVSVGRLHWSKDHVTTLHALRLLIDKGLDVHFTIAGSGDPDQAAGVAFSIRQMHLADHVEIVGPLTRSGVGRLLAEMDVFVLSSVREGISNAALEAMATGLPLVVTDTGGMKELVQDGREGFVVPQRDPEALASALEKLIGDEVLRLDMGSKGRARVEGAFTLKRQIDEFDRLYRDLVAHRAPAQN